MRRFSRYDARLLALRAWGAENRHLTAAISQPSHSIRHVHSTHPCAHTGPIWACKSIHTPVHSNNNNMCKSQLPGPRLCSWGLPGVMSGIGYPEYQHATPRESGVMEYACMRGGAATSRRGRTNPGQRVHPRTHSHVTLQSTAVNRFYSGSTSSNRGQTLPNAPGGTTGPAPGLR